MQSNIGNKLNSINAMYGRRTRTLFMLFVVRLRIMVSNTS